MAKKIKKRGIKRKKTKEKEMKTEKKELKAKETKKVKVKEMKAKEVKMRLGQKKSSNILKYTNVRKGFCIRFLETLKKRHYHNGWSYIYLRDYFFFWVENSAPNMSIILPTICVWFGYVKQKKRNS